MREGTTLEQIRTLYSFGEARDRSDGQLLERFLSTASPSNEGPFLELVRRHGPLVRGVCRSILKDGHDADDAFQATFLVLARRAGSVRNRETLGPWLHGVARRVAVRAKRRSARERDVRRLAAADRPVWADPEPDPDPDQTALDALHEEVARLPDRYRSAVVLCYLEGMTYERAARRLRLSEGAVRGRLARARDLLRSRLTRRGVGHASAIAPAALTAKDFSLARTVLRPETVPAPIPQLAQGVINMTRLSQFKAVAAGMIAACCLVAAPIVWAARPAPNPATPTPEPAARVDPDLARAVDGKIVREVPISKDCMILTHLPEWNFGNVDNIGVENMTGGVRTLLDWPAIDPKEAQDPDRRFVLALYSRGTDANGKGEESLGVHEIDAAWPEITSYQTKPAYDRKPAATAKFEPGDGWKLFDVTPIVRGRAKSGRKANGVVLRFTDEEHTRTDWSGYKFVSREGKGEWEGRRPRLLVVDSRPK